MKNKMKAAENEMEYSSERLYDALVQSTDDFIYICNPNVSISPGTGSVVCPAR